jgi:predicted PurR-regulated permease PerM
MNETKSLTRRSDFGESQARDEPIERFVHRTFIVVGIVAAVAVLLGLLWYAADVLLLVFAGILLAAFLRGLSDPLSKYTGLRAGWALALVILLLVTLIALGGWFIAGQVAIQLDQLVESVPASLAELEQYVRQYAWGRTLLERAPSANQMIRRTDILARVTGLFSTALGIVATVVIVLFVGIYLAADPGLYRRGLVHLVAVHRRKRAEDVCDAVGATLRWWLLGRLLSMIVVSIATTVGLWLLGIPAALALGFLTFLLVFIPYLGPILSAVPAILFALSLSDPMAPVYVGLLYLVIQSVEGYLLTPLVQSHTVRLPPVLTLTAQVLMGVLLGIPGIVLATPLAAVALVLIKMLYVEDTLGEPIGDPMRHDR